MGSFVFMGTPYFSDNRGIIWTMPKDELTYVTKLPTFFSVPMNLPHTFISNIKSGTNEIIFCSYDQTKARVEIEMSVFFFRFDTCTYIC